MAVAARRQGRTEATGGFSLVELLVVVTIVILLIALLLPWVSRSLRVARRVACAANLHTLGIGMLAYQSDFYGILPWDGYAEGDRPVRPVGPWADGSQWFNAAPRYAGSTAYCELQEADAAGTQRLPRDGDKGLFVCPESTAAAPGPKDDLVKDGYFMLWGQDAAGSLDRRKTFWSYGFNTQLDAGLEDRHSDGRVSVPISWIHAAQQTVLLAEKLMRPDELSPRFASSVGQSEVSWREMTTRHDGGGFLLMADGHAAWFTHRELNSTPRAPLDYNLPGRVIWNPAGVAN